MIKINRNKIIIIKGNNNGKRSSSNIFVISYFDKC